MLDSVTKTHLAATGWGARRLGGCIDLHAPTCITMGQKYVPLFCGVIIISYFIKSEEIDCPERKTNQTSGVRGLAHKPLDATLCSI